jgi:ParB-like chromosome segregation protein Spo0J
MEQKLKIEYVPIDSIKEYKRNAKLHPDEQVEQICNSIRKTGFNDPIGVWHGECVEGHGRILAAKKLGMKEVPIIRLDELTDEQRRAYALAHNRLTMNSGFDIELLDMELAEIETIDMTLLGFDEPEQTEQKINVGGELNTDSFSDDKFECTCPKCGFKFNPRGNEDV